MDKLLDNLIALVRENGGNSGLLFLAACALAVYAWHLHLRSGRQKEDLERERLLAARTKEEVARLEAREAARGGERRGAARASPSRVLVVEDNDAMQLIIPAMLKQCLSDPVVKVRATPEEALEELQRFRPELLILDMNLGGQSGLSILQYLREARSDLPVLIYTGYEGEALRVLELRQASGLEHLAVLRKGPDIDAFIQLVPHLFRRRARDRGDASCAPRERRERRARAGDRRGPAHRRPAVLTPSA